MLFFLSFMMVTLMFLILYMLWYYWMCRNFFWNYREDSSPFECGFDPKENARLPFSLHFFLMLVMFLVFDVELSLLIQFPLMKKVNLDIKFILFYLMLFTITLGLMEEWRRGFIKWL